jgi:phosphatidylserine/phosphatidylglycerophosphate/cardiolipin synthase-like enzyme
MIKLVTNENFFNEIKKILQTAEEEIDIIIYNWHFYKNDIGSKVSQLNDILFFKLNRKIKIKVVVGNATLYQELKQKGFHVKYNRVRGLNHAKVIIIDNKWCSVGSHNFSENAFSRNEEASVISDDDVLISQCKTYFDNLFSSCI